MFTTTIWPHLMRNKTRYAIGILLLIVVLQGWCTYGRKTGVNVVDSNEYKVLQGENNALREQNNGLRVEMNDNINKGLAVELERDALAVELQKFGAKAAEGVKIQEEATKENEKEIAIINIPIPQYDRCQRLCTKRAEAGFPCKPNADAFCARYATTP